MTSLNPCFTVGFQIGETLKAHLELDTGRAASARDRAAGGGRHHRSRAAPVGLPAPAVGRHEPARDDRHGDRLPAEAADRRRADDRARRDHPGADPRSPAAAAAGDRHGPRADHPRHGRGGRNRAPRASCNMPASRWSSRTRAAVRAIRTIPTPPRCSRRCPSGRRGACCPPSPASCPGQFDRPAGLPVLAALRLRDRSLPHRAAAPAPPRARHRRCAITPLVSGQPTNRRRAGQS